MQHGGFWTSTRGNVSAMFGLAAVPLVLIAGGAIDYSRAVNAQISLQAAADAAALAAARAKGSDAVRNQHGHDIFKKQVEQDHLLAAVQPRASVRLEKNVATVKAEAVQPNLFLDLIGLGVNPIAVMAQARLRPGRPVCLLALDENASNSIAITGAAEIDAPDCAVQSNSTADNAIRLQGAAKGEAQEFCSAGGFTTNGNGFTPPPVGNCPPVANPLLDLPPPARTSCDPVANSYRRGDPPPAMHPSGTLVICGGLEVRTQADLPLAPGTYVIKDGPLTVGSNALLSGRDVTLYFMGNNTGIHINGGASVDLEAPRTGSYAGLVIVQPPNSNPGGASVITGGGDIRFVGTLYMPSQTISLQGNGEIGNASPAWSMIAARFTLQGNPKITIAADFAAAGYGDAKARTAGGVVLVK